MGNYYYKIFDLYEKWFVLKYKFRIYNSKKHEEYEFCLELVAYLSVNEGCFCVQRRGLSAADVLFSLDAHQQ